MFFELGHLVQLGYVLTNSISLESLNRICHPAFITMMPSTCTNQCGSLCSHPFTPSNRNPFIFYNGKNFCVYLRYPSLMWSSMPTPLKPFLETDLGVVIIEWPVIGYISWCGLIYIPNNGGIGY